MSTGDGHGDDGSQGAMAGAAHQLASGPFPAWLPPEPGVSKIAVLRALSGLGDLIFALPAFEALRSAYPEAEIVLLGTDWHRDLLEPRPSPVDRVVPVPQSRGVRDDAGGDEDGVAVERFLEDMRAERFDLAIQLHGGGRHSNAFVLQLGARTTAGSRSPDAPSLDRWLRYVYHQPEVVRYLEVVALVGARPVHLEPRLATTDADRGEVSHLEGDLIAVHPGSSDARRRWPLERFARLGDRLSALGATVVITGSAAEAAVVEEVAGRMTSPAVALAGQVSLSGLVGLLSRCRLVVGNDSGPLHVAAAVGTPTVGIYWASNFVNSTPLTRARHRPLASFRLRCPVCDHDHTSSRCGHDASFVADIPLDEVHAACQDLVGVEVDHPQSLARALDWRA